MSGQPNRSVPAMPLSLAVREVWSAGDWVAYAELGASQGERARRVGEAPERLRPQVVQVLARRVELRGGPLSAAQRREAEVAHQAALAEERRRTRGRPGSAAA